MNVLSEVPNPPLSAVKVFYNDCQLVPGPLIDWTEEPQFTDDGIRTSVVTRLTLTGSVLITPSGSYEQMYSKQEDLRSAFAVDNGDFVILAGPGNKTLPEDTVICSGLKPKVTSLNITPDIHVTKFDYTVDLEALTAVSGISGITSSLSNQWSFSEDPDSCTVQVTHTVSAEGPEGQADKFQQALAAVKPLLGIDQLPIQIPFFVEPNASGLFGITHPSNSAGGPIFEVSVQREEVADVANGSYSVTEIFTIVSGVPFFFASRTESFDEDQEGIATVSIQGTVQGLGRTISPSFGADGGIGFDRASSGFLNHIKPNLLSDASGVYLKYKDPVVAANDVLTLTALSIAQNKCRGTVDFNASYTDDPSVLLPSGIASLISSVARTEGLRISASHAIPFRSLGNIIQDIETTSEGRVSANVNVVAKNTGEATVDTNRAITVCEDELNRLKDIYANPADFITIRIASINQTVSDKDLSCDATVEFTFTVDLANVQSINSDISLKTL